MPDVPADTRHEPSLSIQERLRRHGYDWRTMTIIGIDMALREIRDQDRPLSEARRKSPTSEPIGSPPVR